MSALRSVLVQEFTQSWRHLLSNESSKAVDFLKTISSLNKRAIEALDRSLLYNITHQVLSEKFDDPNQIVIGTIKVVKSMIELPEARDSIYSVMRGIQLADCVAADIFDSSNVKVI